MVSTLPAGWYGDAEVHQRERHAVWGREWTVFAPAAMLAAPGQYVADEIGGWPTFVVVAPDGSRRGFHNVCPHRAGVIVWPGEGTASNLVCRYHGWAFRHDGSLRSARDFGDAPGFCPAEQRLVPISVAEWANLVWVSLAPDPPPLLDHLGSLVDRCADLAIDRFTFDHRLVRHLACNWKTYADNYLEGYHVPILHPRLARDVDMGRYEVEVSPDGYCEHRAVPAPGAVTAGRWLFRWPNLALNVYGSGMNVERIVPRGPHRTDVVYDYFFADPGDPGRRAEREAMIELSNITLDEDQAICEAVQRNLEAGVYHRGELSPKHEEALAWFQGMIAAAVGEVSLAG